MFGRRSPAAKIAAVDHAYDQAIANVREFGLRVAARIINDFRAGFIGRAGVDQAADAAIADTSAAAAAANLPEVMRQQIVAALRETVEHELADAGLTIAKAPAP